MNFISKLLVIGFVSASIVSCADSKNVLFKGTMAKKHGAGDGIPKGFQSDGKMADGSTVVVAGGSNAAGNNGGPLNDGSNPGNNGGGSSDPACVNGTVATSTVASAAVAFAMKCAVEESTSGGTSTGAVPKSSTAGTSTGVATGGSAGPSTSTTGSTTSTTTTGGSTTAATTTTGGSTGSSTGSTSGTVTGGPATGGVCSKQSGTTAATVIAGCFNQIVKAAGIKSINITGLPHVATATFYNCILPSTLATFVVEVDSSGAITSAPDGLPTTEMHCGGVSCAPGDALNGYGILANSCTEAD